MIAAALIALGLAAHAWQQRQTPEGRYFAGVMVASAMFTFAAAAEYVAVDYAVMLFWGKVAYMGLVMIAPFWFMFVLQAFGRSTTWTPPRLALLWAPLLAGMALCWTNSRHGLIWSRIVPVQDAFGARLIYTAGPVAWLLAGYGYALFIYAFVLVVKAVVQTHGPRRRVWALMLLASTVPFLFNVIYLVGPARGRAST